MKLPSSDQADYHRGLKQGSDASLKSCTGRGRALGPKAGGYGMLDLFPIPRFPQSQDQKTLRHLGPSPQTLPLEADAWRQLFTQRLALQHVCPQAGQAMETGIHNRVIGGFRIKIHRIQAE